VNASLVWIFAREADVDPFAIAFGIQPFDCLQRNAFERLLSLGSFIKYFLESFLFPTLFFGFIES
jgi:hypothetical protein